MADENAFLTGSCTASGARDISASLAEIGLKLRAYLINRVAAQWNFDLADELRAFDLTTPQMRALAVLGIKSGLTMNELSGLRGDRAIDDERTIDSLEARGLVRRQQRMDDMRVERGELRQRDVMPSTPSGPLMFRRYQQMFRDIGEDEYAQFVATLHRIPSQHRLGDAAGSE